MSLKPFFKKLISPIMWGNCLGMLLFLLLVGIAITMGLRAYTHHGEAVTVPDVGCLQMSEARKVLTDAGLGVAVTDTGFVKELPMDCVLEQSPAAGVSVKPGRVIALIVNASTTPTLALPDIIQNSSLREAMARLKSMGFKVGEPEYVRGERDWVYGITVDGRPRATGDRIPINKVVVVQAGNGYMEKEDSVVYVNVDYVPMEEDSLLDDIDDFIELIE